MILEGSTLPRNSKSISSCDFICRSVDVLEMEVRKTVPTIPAEKPFMSFMVDVKMPPENRRWLWNSVR